jgi:cell division protein FtsL
VTTPAAAPVESPAVARTARRRAAQRQRGGALVSSGVAWIVCIAVLLAGIVAVNVSVLRLNVRLSGLERERANLHAEIAQLELESSSAASPPRIERAARRSGLVPADAANTTYVFLNRRRP